MFKILSDSDSVRDFAKWCSQFMTHDQIVKIAHAPGAIEFDHTKLLIEHESGLKVEVTTQLLFRYLLQFEPNFAATCQIVDAYDHIKFNKIPNSISWSCIPLELPKVIALKHETMEYNYLFDSKHNELIIISSGGFITLTFIHYFESIT